jgi:hypothetical protein
MTAPTPDTERSFFRQASISSLDAALERFRAAYLAHNDIEPMLETERAADGRRRFVLSLYVRPTKRGTSDGDTAPPV